MWDLEERRKKKKKATTKLKEKSEFLSDKSKEDVLDSFFVVFEGVVSQQSKRMQDPN